MRYCPRYGGQCSIPNCTCPEPAMPMRQKLFRWLRERKFW